MRFKKKINLIYTKTIVHFLFPISFFLFFFLIILKTLNIKIYKKKLVELDFISSKEDILPTLLIRIRKTDPCHDTNFLF